MQLNDLKFEALGDQGFTGSITDRWQQWLEANGATVGSAIPDQERDVLESNGFWSSPEQQLNDGWFAFLESLGYPQGSLNERWYAFWLDGGTLGPPPIPDWESTPTPVGALTDVPYSYDLGQHLNTRAGIVLSTTAGALPAGLSYSGTRIVGTPTTVENQTGIVTTATNLSGSDASDPYSINVQFGVVQWISTPTPPSGVQGEAYNYDLSVHLNGTDGVTITDPSNDLPDGLSIVGTSITGTPTQEGVFNNIRLVATGRANSAQSDAFNIVITGEPIPAPVWESTPSPPSGNDGIAYFYDLAPHLNTTEGVVITVTNGALPDGLEIIQATIQGTPTETGVFPMQLTATNLSGSDESDPFEITIAPGVVRWVTTPTPPDGQEGSGYTHDFGQYLNVTNNVTMELQSGTLPPGLDINGLAIEGTPTAQGLYPNIVLRAINEFGLDDSQPFSMNIVEAGDPVVVRLDDPVQNGKEVLDNGQEFFTPTPSGLWPPYGAHAQSSANVAGLDTTLSDPLFSPWQRKKDLVYLQGLYPTQNRVRNTTAGVADMRRDNANIKILEYVYPHRTNNSGQTDILGLMWETVEERNGETQWRGVDANSDSLIWDNQGRIFLNPNHEGVDPAGGALNFAIACCEKYEQRSGEGHPDSNLRQAVDGVFWDSMDFQDRFPTQRNEDDTENVRIDYLKPKSSGSSDPALYRDGIKYFVQQWRDLFGADQVHSGNGGRDRDATNKTTAENEWAGFWDHRLSENFQQKIGLEKKSGVNELETTFSNTDDRLNRGIQTLLISAEMVDKTEENRLGKGLVSIDWVSEWSGANPTSVADIPQDFYEAGRFICGLACLDDNFLAGPQLQRGTLPWPYMDEFVYDPGNPVGGVPSIGFVDNTDIDYPLTRRAADDNGFYWQEYDNVLWVVNLNPPAGNSDWPQFATDVCVLPDPGPGNVWRFADSNYVNPNRTTGGTAAENQSPLVNTGGLVGPTLTIGRWIARMLVRSPS